MPRKVMFRGRLLTLPDRRQPTGRLYEWRMTRSVWYRFKELLDQWEQLTDDHPDRPVLEDDMRRLPGFPHDMNPDLDEFQPVVTDRDYI